MRIDPRFRGPAESGNGGYSAGLLAELLEGDVEVTLRRPPPLDRELAVERDGDRVLLLDGELLVAEAVTTSLTLELPPSPGVEAARRAAEAFAGYRHHAFPTCFSCGPDRADGLAIYPGPSGEDLVADTFEPDATLPAVDGVLTPPVVWAALDCAGAWAEHRAEAEATLVLGRVAAHLEGPVRVGETYVVVGWPIAVEGRKRFSGTALYDAEGKPLGWTRQTWIVIG